MTYERACQLHRDAREAIATAEDKLKQNPRLFDAAWQEMLNNADIKVCAELSSFDMFYWTHEGKVLCNEACPSERP